jgi:hypothetical protein
MAFSDQAALAVDAAFQAKVRVALVTAAVDVMGEDKTGMSDAKYGKRQALAYAVLQSGGASQTERFAWAVAANVAVSSGSTDSDIQFTVNSVWDDMSGVVGGE